MRSAEWFSGPEYYNSARRNANLRQVAEAVKRGVLQAGGFPFEFPTMSLGEMFLRPTSMLYRNLMAMEVEESICARLRQDRKLGAGTDGRKLFDLFRTGQLPGCAAIPAPDSRRLAIAELSGRRIVEKVHAELKPSDIITRQSLENAITVHMALGGSTNAVVHLLANTGMEDFFEAGGVPVVMAEVLSWLHADCIAVNGKTVAQNVSGAECWNKNVIRRLHDPLAAEGGTAILYGNLAPDGAVIKPTAASPVVFETHEQMREQIESEDLPVDRNSVLASRMLCGCRMRV